MPIVYVGRTNSFIGKSLWEILGNLKNFGVGRIVIRNVFKRYPEPSYYKICKVEAVNNSDPRKVHVWAQHVFRGRLYPELLEILPTSYKPDFRLIPKDEEASYCSYEMPKDKLNKLGKLPSHGEFPPLLRELLIRDMKRRGEPVKEPLMKMMYRQGIDNVRRVAEEDEVAGILKCDLGKPASPQLYENI